MKAILLIARVNRLTMHDQFNNYILFFISNIDALLKTKYNRYFLTILGQIEIYSCSLQDSFNSSQSTIL